MTEAKVKHTITIDPVLLKEIKLLAVRKDIRYGQAIEEAVRDYILKHNKDKK